MGRRGVPRKVAPGSAGPRTVVPFCIPPRVPVRVAVFALLVLASQAVAQPADDLAPPMPDTSAARFATSATLALTLTEDGLAGGLAGRLRLSNDLSLTAEVSAGAARDTREQRFFVGFFGDTVTPLKRSYAALVPLHVGLERRLFRATVEDNFRPFVALAAGPTLAVQWPYFRDLDGDGVRDSSEVRLGTTEGLGDAEARLGVGGSLAVGAYFGRGRRAVQGLRLGFTLHYFPVAIDLLEQDPAVERPSRKTFYTPTVSFLIVRLVR